MTSLLNLAMPLSSTLDLVSPRIVNHHRRVGYIAYLLGVELNFPLEQRKKLLLAGLFHDIGALSLKERIDALDFEIARPHEHAEVGYRLLREFEPFADMAEVVRFHHVPWAGGAGEVFRGQAVPMESHIIHLADRVSILIPGQEAVLGRAHLIMQEIEQQAGIMFQPELVKVLRKLAGKEYFWLDAASPWPTETLRSVIDSDSIEFDLDAIQGLSNLFTKVVDFRSPFTATHSTGVAAIAEKLARLAGFSERESQLMRIAGHLHDLGKLAVPASVLEKPGKLTSEEWDVIRAHTFFGFRALQKSPVLETVNLWGALHHERLDGSGYPFHLTAAELPLGSRIMAVADIFAALAEDRPYRLGMEMQATMKILTDIARSGGIDGEIVHLLQTNLQEIKECWQTTAAQALANYQSLLLTANAR